MKFLTVPSGTSLRNSLFLRCWRSAVFLAERIILGGALALNSCDGCANWSGFDL